MTEKEHTKIAKDLLVGKKIKEVIYLSSFDADQMLWDRRSIMIIFEDGSSIIPMSDDEGNNGGALHYHDHGKTETIGVLWND
tara:strand:- start:349 stop:594 length:246 start_codon:yes stop_codon:yes gene_type:complete